MSYWYEISRASKANKGKSLRDPKYLWQRACEYFKWCDENPWLKTDFRGKDTIEVQIPTERPYTIVGLSGWLGKNEKYLINLKAEISQNIEENQELYDIISQIWNVIETQQFEGATVGAFNANIISRKLGLADKTESKQTGNIVFNVTQEEADV